MQPQGVRLEWSAVAESVQREVAATLGSPVVVAENQPGGFSPGVAARCELADGRRVFIKCVSPAQNPLTPDMHRSEAVITASLPAGLPVPELLHVLDDGEWVTLIFEEVIGAPPSLPWSFDDLAHTFEALDQLTAATTPCPVPGLSISANRLQSTFDGYRRLAGDRGRVIDELDDWTRRHLDDLAAREPEWEAAVAGSSLVHSDVRADNLLVTPEGTIVLVDWPHAFIGAGWFDKVCMLPSVGLDGGPSPMDVETRLDPFAGIDPQAIDAVVVALAGYFTHRSLEPDPPGLPTVRPFQRAQGEVTRAWLAARVDLP